MIYGKKGQNMFSMQKLLISVLFVGLMATVISVSIAQLQQDYGITDFNSTSIENIQSIAIEQEELIDGVKGNVTAIKSDEGVFDIIGNFINKATAPFRLLTNAYSFLVGENSVLTNTIGFLGIDATIQQALNTFLVAMVIVLVFVGVFLFKIYLGKEDN